MTVTDSRQPIIALSWESIHHAIDALTYEIMFNKPEVIVGVARGGLIPATMLSNRLNIPMKVVSAQSYTGTRRTIGGRTEIVGWDPSFSSDKVLFVDDILDTGETKAAIDLMDLSRKVRYATIVNKRPLLHPTAHFITVDPSVWIKFPWES